MLGDHLGGEALRHETGIAGVHLGPERIAPRQQRRAHRHAAHALDPRRDHHVVGARDDALRGEVQRLLRRAALTVDRRSGHRVGEARGERGVAPDVQGLVAHLHDAAHDHVVDQRGIEIVAVDQCTQRVGGEVDGMPAREHAVAATERRPDGVDDHCVSHPPSLSHLGSGRMRNLDKSLGDGGMPLLEQLGLSFERYGEGWAEATWTPTDLACNPIGPVHGGVYGVVHDAAMNFATNSALERGDRSATLDISYQTRRAASAGTPLSVRGEVVQLTKSVAYVESTISNAADGEIVSRGMATFAVRRADR